MDEISRSDADDSTAEPVCPVDKLLHYTFVCKCKKTHIILRTERCTRSLQGSQACSTPVKPES